MMRLYHVHIPILCSYLTQLTCYEYSNSSLGHVIFIFRMLISSQNSIVCFSLTIKYSVFWFKTRTTRCHLFEYTTRRLLEFTRLAQH